MGKGLIDILYELLVSPSKALGEITRVRPLGQSILTATFIAIVLSFTFVLNPPQLVEVVFDLERGSFNYALAVLIWVLIFLAALIIEGGIFHFISLLLQGRGSYLGMICAMCFACVPFVFFAPLTFIRALLGSAGPVFYATLYPFLFFWTFLLAVNAIRLNYNFTLLKAAAIYFIPGFLLIVIPVFVITVILPL